MNPATGVLRFSVTFLAIVLTACGGGGGGSSMPGPSALQYPTPPAFVINQAIAALSPTVTGAVTLYTVSPSLPAGLSIAPATGVISGTPTAVAANATYTVTAANTDGGTSATVSITVNDVTPTLAYASPYYAFTANLASQTITPTLGAARSSVGALVQRYLRD
jgi:hypothetical protein